MREELDRTLTKVHEHGDAQSKRYGKAVGRRLGKSDIEALCVCILAGGGGSHSSKSRPTYLDYSSQPICPDAASHDESRWVNDF